MRVFFQVIFYWHMIAVTAFALSGGDLPIVNATIFYNVVFLASLFWILEGENKLKIIAHVTEYD